MKLIKINMKKITIITMVAILTMLVSFKTSDKVAWSIDKDHAKLGFTVSHLMVSDVEGWFKTFTATVTASGKDFTDAVVVMSADANSINTESEARDKHLRSADFFDVVKYPVIAFKSKTFTKVNDANYKVTGDLTMHGVTRAIELNATCKLGTNPTNKKEVAGFKITGEINRIDFGIGSSMPNAMVGDKVSIVANAELIKI
jgi:polyisoprenoid-binding protein YceI